MNTKLSTQIENLVKRYNQALEHKNENEELEHEAQMLMFEYVSEVEKLLEANKLKRKTLAERIKTSASYLTQVFRGDKPLNFFTIAKIQKALGVKFKIEVIPLSQSEFAMYMPNGANSNNKNPYAKNSNPIETVPFSMYQGQEHYSKSSYRA